MIPLGAREAVPIEHLSISSRGSAVWTYTSGRRCVRAFPITTSRFLHPYGDPPRRRQCRRRQRRDRGGSLPYLSCTPLRNLQPGRAASTHPGAAQWPCRVPLSGHLPSLPYIPDRKPVPRKRPNFGHLELLTRAREIWRYPPISHVE